MLKATNKPICSFLAYVFSGLGYSQPLIKCKRIFQALINISIEELCETADSLIAPVRMGVARPTAPFSLVSTNVDAIQGSEEIFAADPLQPRSTTEESSSHSTAYIPPPRSPPRVDPMGQGRGERMEDDMVAADVEEVSE